jgi:hypothetical protein
MVPTLYIPALWALTRLLARHIRTRNVSSSISSISRLPVPVFWSALGLEDTVTDCVGYLSPCQTTTWHQPRHSLTYATRRTTNRVAAEPQVFV